MKHFLTLILILFSAGTPAQFLTGISPRGSGSHLPGSTPPAGTASPTQSESGAGFIFKPNQLDIFFDSTENGYYPIRFNPITSHPDHVPFQFAISSNNQYPYTGKNNVMMWGWNIGYGGGNFIAGRPGIGYSLESNYHPDNDSFTTWVESHEFYLTPQGKQIRLKSYTISTSENGMIDLYHTTDNLYLRSKKNSNHTPVGFSISNDSLGQINFSGTGPDGRLTQYVIGTGNGTVNFGPTGGRTSSLMINNFNSVHFGQPGDLVYNGIEGQFEYFAAAGEVNINRGGTLIPRINFNFSQNNPGNFSIFADYNTNTYGMETSAAEAQFIEFGTGGNRILQVSEKGVKVGSLNTASQPSAALEINSTTQGVLLPRLSVDQRNSISNPQNGLIIYNTDTKKFQGYADNKWVDLHH